MSECSEQSVGPIGMKPVPPTVGQVEDSHIGFTRLQTDHVCVVDSDPRGFFEMHLAGRKPAKAKAKQALGEPMALYPDV